MAGHSLLLIVISMCLGCVALCQTGSGGQQQQLASVAAAPAAGALPKAVFDDQKVNEPGFAAVYCSKALSFTHDAYVYTGNFSMVPNVPQPDAGNYVFCYTLPPVGISVLEMLCVMHYLPQVGLTVRQLINMGYGAQGSYEQLASYARTVESYDNSLWAGVSKTFLAPFVDVHLLGLVIFGKTDADMGTKFVCSCIMQIVPTLDPATQAPVTSAPPGGGLDAPSATANASAPAFTTSSLATMPAVPAPAPVALHAPAPALASLMVPAPVPSAPYTGPAVAPTAPARAIAPAPGHANRALAHVLAAVAAPAPGPSSPANKPSVSAIAVAPAPGHAVSALAPDLAAVAASAPGPSNQAIAPAHKAKSGPAPALPSGKRIGTAAVAAPIPGAISLFPGV